jgi:aspartate ammonia-lyase
MRKEHDFLGELEVPDDVYYGVQTLRAMENFTITEERLDKDFIVSMAAVKKAAAIANMKTGRMPEKIGNALVQAADEIIAGKLHDQFPVDPIQGGAGTSVNMNTNEVLCNRALEIIGEAKGRYDIISPNNHANMAQSTNDAFPTGIKVCAIRKSKPLLKALQRLVDELDKKAVEYKDILKMGRTHLQDAVPITLGQEMASKATAIRRGMKRIEFALKAVHVVNMGATAVGTGLNAEPEYIKMVVDELSNVTGEKFITASNLIDATNNTDAFADVSAGLKVTALVLIKMANDFRLMASGPRCGLNELKLPPRQPGSSIMPGKVNPVMAEVLDQTCYQIIGNDVTISLGVENGQFELNVMEPVIAFNLFNSMRYMTNAVNNFVDHLMINLQANREQCEYWLDRSVGIITALLPHIGYENCSMLAKEAYATGRPIREIILEKGLLEKADMEHILSPEEMTQPGIAGKDLLEKTTKIIGK